MEKEGSPAKGAAEAPTASMESLPASVPTAAAEEPQSVSAGDQERTEGGTGGPGQERDKLKNKIQFASLHLVGNHFPDIENKAL